MIAEARGGRSTRSASRSSGRSSPGARLLARARPDDAGRLARGARRPRRGADGRGRRSVGARPRLALGADPRDPAAARPVGEPAPGPAAGGDPRPARRPRARRRRHALPAREHRGRVLGRRRPGAPGASVGGRHRDERLHPRRASSASSATPSSWRNGGAASSRARPSRTRRASATCSGTRSPRRSPRSSPASRYERVLVDALAARMVRDPGSLDVVVASNLFGDILTDLAAAIQGGMGMAASANVAPGSGHARPVRARARLGARHRRAGDREPGRRDLERGADARAHRRAGGVHATLMAALEDVCRDGPRTRDVGGGAATREVGEAVAAPGGRAQRTIPMIALPATTSTPAATSRGPIRSLCLADQERGEEHGPQRLGRVQRSDDRHAAAVERLQQARVGEPEDDAGEREGGQRRPQVMVRSDAAAPDQHPDEDDEERAEQRGGRGGERRRMGVAGGPAGDVVADGEERGAGEGEDDAEHPEVLRSRPLAGERGSAGDHEHRSEQRAAAGTARPRSTSAIATDISGAVPIRIATRDGPTSRTATMKRICVTPGHQGADQQERPEVARVDVAGRDRRGCRARPTITSADAGDDQRPRARGRRRAAGRGGWRRRTTPNSAPASAAKRTAPTD